MRKRMCGNYKPLNAVTPPNRYPMPMHDAIEDYRILTTTDLRQWFKQLKIAADKDKKKEHIEGNKPLRQLEQCLVAAREAQAMGCVTRQP